MRLLFSSVIVICLSFGVAEADPQTDYMLKCMGCHGPDGAEVTGKVPALKDNVARFFNADGGRAYIVQVPGARQSPLSNKDLTALLNWLGPRFDATHMPDDFVPYTEAEVQHLRQTRISDVEAIRAGLMAALAEAEKD